MPGFISDTPRHNGGIRWTLVDLHRRRPACAVIFGEAVVDVVVVAEYRVEVAHPVNAHIHELVAVGDGRGRIIIDHVVGEGFATISRNGHPHHVIATCTLRAAHSLASI